MPISTRRNWKGLSAEEPLREESKHRGSRPCGIDPFQEQQVVNLRRLDSLEEMMQKALNQMQRMEALLKGEGKDGELEEYLKDERLKYSDGLRARVVAWWNPIDGENSHLGEEIEEHFKTVHLGEKIEDLAVENSDKKIEEHEAVWNATNLNGNSDRTKSDLIGAKVLVEDQDRVDFLHVKLTNRKKFVSAKENSSLIKEQKRSRSCDIILQKKENAPFEWEKSIDSLEVDESVKDEKLQRFAWSKEERENFLNIERARYAARYQNANSHISLDILYEGTDTKKNIDSPIEYKHMDNVVEGDTLTTSFLDSVVSQNLGKTWSDETYILNSYCHTTPHSGWPREVVTREDDDPQYPRCGKDPVCELLDLNQGSDLEKKSELTINKSGFVSKDLVIDGALAVQKMESGRRPGVHAVNREVCQIDAKALTTQRQLECCFLEMPKTKASRSIYEKEKQLGVVVQLTIEEGKGSNREVVSLSILSKFDALNRSELFTRVPQQDLFWWNSIIHICVKYGNHGLFASTSLHPSRFKTPNQVEDFVIPNFATFADSLARLKGIRQIDLLSNLTFQNVHCMLDYLNKLHLCHEIVDCGLDKRNLSHGAVFTDFSFKNNLELTVTLGNKGLHEVLEGIPHDSSSELSSECIMLFPFQQFSCMILLSCHWRRKYEGLTSSCLFKGFSLHTTAYTELGVEGTYFALTPMIFDYHNILGVDLLEENAGNIDLLVQKPEIDMSVVQVSAQVITPNLQVKFIDWQMVDIQLVVLDQLVDKGIDDKALWNLDHVHLAALDCRRQMLYKELQFNAKAPPIKQHFGDEFFERSEVSKCMPYADPFLNTVYQGAKVPNRRVVHLYNMNYLFPLTSRKGPFTCPTFVKTLSELLVTVKIWLQDVVRWNRFKLRTLSKLLRLHVATEVDSFTETNFKQLAIESVNSRESRLDWDPDGAVSNWCHEVSSKTLHQLTVEHDSGQLRVIWDPGGSQSLPTTMVDRRKNVCRNISSTARLFQLHCLSPLGGLFGVISLGSSGYPLSADPLCCMYAHAKRGGMM